MRLFLVLCFLVCSDALFSQTPAWQRVNPLPFGETVVEIQKIPGTNRLIAACEYSSVLISDNGGETWQTILYSGNLPGDFKVVGLYFLNDTTGFLYGEGPVILKTTDAGITWKTCRLPNNYHSDLIAMVFSDESYGFAIGDQTTVLKTYDKGEIWYEKYISGPDSYFLTSIDFANNKNGFITGSPFLTTDYGIIKTHDWGDNWYFESVVEGIEGLINNIHFISSLIGFASSGRSIYRTTDGGGHWQEVYNDVTSPGFIRYNFEFYNNLKGIAFYKSGYYPSAFFLTSDGGVTWQPVNQPGENVCCNDLVYYDENTLFSAGDNGCMFKSVDGGLTWEKISHISISGYIHEVKLIDENSGFFVNEYQIPDRSYFEYDIVKTNDGFNTFDTILALDYYPVKIDFLDQDTGYVVKSNPNANLLMICRTTNGGQAWIIDSLEISSWVKSIDFYNGKKGLISFYRRLLLTSNGGNSWQEKTFSNDVGINDACYVSASKIIVSATDQSGPMLHVSVDNGQTWSMIIETVPVSGKLCFIDEMSGFIIADTLAYKTTDGGYSWTRCGINVPGFRIYDITFPSQNTGYIVGKSDYENVLKTTDGGLTWNPIHAPDVFPYYNVEFTDSETGYIFSGNIIHKTTTGGILGEEPHPPLASKFHAYPNPFQSGIHIDVSDRNIQTAYQMNVFSLNGVQLYSTTIQPQTSSIWFQGSMLSPGTYVFQFRCGNEVIGTLKVVKIQ